MPDPTKLSPAAQAAAMRTGTAGWGQAGSVDQARYMEPAPKRAGRSKQCGCGCGRPVTHIGMANGVGLIAGCHWRVRRWVKAGE